MKSLVFLLSLMFVFSCKHTIDHDNTKPVTFKDTVASTSDSVFRINKIPLLAQIKKETGSIYSVTTIDHKVVIAPADYYNNLEVLDINRDGFDDFRIFEISNMPNQCQNFFYDPKTKEFKRIANSDLDIRLLPKTNLFYTYNSVGCADRSWESYLCRIVDFRQVSIGHIMAHDCDDENDGITFYKIVTDDKILKIERKPDPNFEIEGRNNKWDYIEKYWVNNYKKYE